MYIITIKKKHARDARFDNLRDGPLIRAIREQQPDLNPLLELSEFVLLEDRTQLPFDEADYNREMVRELQAGQRESITVKLYTA